MNKNNIKETGKYFIYVGATGDIHVVQTASGSALQKFGNCFTTREQAEEARERIKQVLDNYQRELKNGGR